MTEKKRHTIERVTRIAAERFARLPLEKVSVGEIAAAAHCSTATIYEIFGSKEGLYRCALENEMALTPLPKPEHTGGGSPLIALLEFLEDRIRNLSDPDHVTTQRLISTHIALAGDIISPRKDRVQRQLAASIELEVQRAINAGLIRQLDVESVTYILLACSAYEPLVSALFTPQPKEVDVFILLRKTFAPLLTDEGSIAFESWIIASSF